MKTRNLEPNSLGQKEDWSGNNIAIECPVCAKVYIVSARIHGERKCPGCGRSRGIVRGGRDSGGKASVVWGDSPTFVEGQTYTRKHISEKLGGSEIDYLPMEDKRVVCGCFTLDHNPEAPNIIVPGTGKIIEREAKQFCKQDYPVPIFLKRDVNKWEYVGDYKAARYSTDPAEIKAHHCGSITDQASITRVIFLQRANKHCVEQ